MGNNKCCGDYTDDQQWCIVNDNKMRLAMTDVATNDDQEFDNKGRRVSQLVQFNSFIDKNVTLKEIISLYIPI